MFGGFRKIFARLTGPKIAALAAITIGVGGFVAPHEAAAMPQAVAAFCAVYPDAKACVSGAVPCAMCHTTPPQRNAYGAALSMRIAPGQPRPLTPDVFLAGLRDALKVAEHEDADGDGITNIAEILAGTFPGDAASFPVTLTGKPGEARAATAQRWNTCAYDPVYAFRKVSLDVCGRSATRAEVSKFQALASNRERWEPALSAELDRCLTSR